MADVVAQSEAYGKFSKDMGTKYAQAIMTPMHADDTNDYAHSLGTGPMVKCMRSGVYANDYGELVVVTLPILRR